MTWLGGVDGARRHIAGVPFDHPITDASEPTRKTVYGMVERGLRVARIGEESTDSRGRRRKGRMIFAAEWIDAFLCERAGGTVTPFSKRGAA